MAPTRKHPKPDPSPLAMRLRLVRERAGLTQSQLASMTGRADPRAVWRYENENVVPDGETMALVAKIGEVDCAWLITGDGVEPEWFATSAAPSAA